MRKIEFLALLGLSGTITAATFKPTEIKAPFIEQFDETWDQRWNQSPSSKFQVKEPYVYPGIEGDKGLVATQKAAQYAISSVFDEVVDTKGEKPLIVQYEVKLQEGLDCGGAYLKLLSHHFKSGDEFTNNTPYTIMFGPDKCGSTNKVHFIFRHANPVTGEIEEKHLNAPPTIKQTKTTALYTLIINPDNTYQILINNDNVKSGSLFTDFTPPVNPPKELDDPHDFRPDDWPEAVIPDPNATKPDDHDEDAPRYIEDPNSQKPEGWLEDQEPMIPDPNSQKPDEWDDDEDGPYIPPLIANPLCEFAEGCGKWSPPLIANPNYKGKWFPPMIVNPDFKGPWEPRKIPNPNYFEDKQPSNLIPISAVGFEIWTMSPSILFDNIYVGYSKEDANALADETYNVKKPLEEKREREALEATFEDPIETTGKTYDLITMIRQNLIDFIAKLNADPVMAMKDRWDVAGILALTISIFLGTLGTLVGIIGGATKSKNVPKVSVKEVNDKKGKVKENEAQSADESNNGKQPQAISTATDETEKNVKKRKT